MPKSTDSYHLPSVNFDSDFDLAPPVLPESPRRINFGHFTISPPVLPTTPEEYADSDIPDSPIDKNSGQVGEEAVAEHLENDSTAEKSYASYKAPYIEEVHDVPDTERDASSVGSRQDVGVPVAKSGNPNGPGSVKGEAESDFSSEGFRTYQNGPSHTLPSKENFRDGTDEDDFVDSPTAPTPPEYETRPPQSHESATEDAHPFPYANANTLNSAQPDTPDWDTEEQEQMQRAMQLSRETAAAEAQRRSMIEQNRLHVRLSKIEASQSSPKTTCPPQHIPATALNDPVVPTGDMTQERRSGVMGIVRDTIHQIQEQGRHLNNPDILAANQPPHYTPPTERHFNSAFVSPKPAVYTAWHPSMATEDTRGLSRSQDTSTLRRELSNSYRPERTPNSMRNAQKPPLSLVVPEQSRGRTPSVSGGRLRIRENSRHRNEFDERKSGQQCDDCQHVGPERSFCNVCKLVYCDPCWSRQPTHRRPTGPIPHEKTEQRVAKTVKKALDPELTDEQRMELHKADIDTTWFGVARDDEELPLFRDYGRVAALLKETRDIRTENLATLSASSDHSETMYPSLVSFVGETGAGKSTLIKLLIDLKAAEGEQPRFPTPVVGASGREVPTSEDVHLYLDPDSSESQAPLLFADCEGLDGGERDPVGARLKRKIAQEAKAAAAEGGRRRRRLKHTSERELVWADTPRKKSREFAVAQLYPRLLYTFSDVIVFVLKNARVIEKVLVRLVEWASAALEKSSNQPVLPHAIIALNASENNIEEDLWDVDKATEAMMESLSREVYRNPIFKKYAQFWRDRDRQIESVQELLLSYYSSLRVVRIPTDGRPNLINGQMQKLSSMVRWASKRARDRRADLRMLLDADEFQPYLQTAFDHFATNLDTPFDFVQASFANSPIPNDFGGNILKLAIQVMECWKDRARGPIIFEELSYLVASCIMLNAARDKVRGTDEDIFPMYLDHLDNALENFCDRHWPCEFSDSRKGRCVNVRSGHGAKGHQSKSGKLLAAGEYFSTFSFDGYMQTFRDNTYEKLKILRKLVRSRAEEGERAEDQAAAEIHRELVLPYFFQHAAGESAETFTSHTVCFCCLFEPPEHALPCGHIICTPCLRTYGKLQLRTYIEISECPLEKKAKHWRKPWQVYLKPPSCGIRVLTLDGGGVRGIVELEILRQIAKELGGGLHIQSLFDLIVGTSTGGIIALGLTVRDWTLDECATQFEALCASAFTLRRGIRVPALSWIVSNYNHSMYETRPLQEALIGAFTDEQYLFGGRKRDQGTMDVKVAVTATSAGGNAVVLANYNRPCHEKINYHFQRPENLYGELKTWEAARATSAAPTYFKPFCHESSKQVYSDGGIYNNNPIFIADRERKLIWPAQEHDEPDIILSIGTMHCKKAKPKPSARFPARGILNHGRFLSKLAENHMHSDLDSEQTWLKYLSTRSPSKENRDRYVRINPEITGSVPKLDDTAQFGKLQESTREMLASSMQIKHVARRLIATCFHYDPFGDVRENTARDLFEVQGYFRCRFLAGQEVAEIGKFIRQNTAPGHDACFLIEDADNDADTPQEIRIGPAVLNRMIERRQFYLDQHVMIARASQTSRTNVSLCLRRGAKYPISGFPRALHAARATQIHGQGGRHILASTNSVRWAGRTKSQQQRRVEWEPPSVAPPAEKEDIIARYSDVTHLLGSATRMDLTPPSSRHHHGDDNRTEPPSATDDNVDPFRSHYAELSADETSTYTLQSARSNQPWDYSSDSFPIELDSRELPRRAPSELDST